jgi:hypothetical protein
MQDLTPHPCHIHALQETRVSYRDNFCVDLGCSALKSINAIPDPTPRHGGGVDSHVVADGELIFMTQQNGTELWSGHL